MNSPTQTRQPRRTRRPARPPAQAKETRQSPVIDKIGFRVHEAARALGVSTASMERWIAEGTMPSTKIGGVRLILRKHLEHFDRVIARQQAS